MKPLETLGVLLFVSAAFVYYAFNFTGWLGPYGQANDVYHEIILGALVFISLLFILMAQRQGALEVAR